MQSLEGQCDRGAQAGGTDKAFLGSQTKVSAQIVTALDSYRDARENYRNRFSLASTARRL